MKTQIETKPETTDEVEAEIKQPDVSKDYGNYIVIVEHQNGQRKEYAVVNGTVNIAVFDSGSFPVR